MTGLELHDEVLWKLNEDGFASPTPERFLAVLNNKMRDLNSFTPVYWRRRILTTRAGCRVAVTSDPILGVIKGSITDTSRHLKKRLSPQPTMQFSGVGHTADADGLPGFPNCIWLEYDMNDPYVYIVLDPRPDKTYYAHLALHYRVPAYTNLVLSLPVHELTHPIIVEGVLADFTETEDFHRKSIHVEHLQLYIAGRKTARALVEHATESRADQVDRFRARSYGYPGRDEGY